MASESTKKRGNVCMYSGVFVQPLLQTNINKYLIF